MIVARTASGTTYGITGAATHVTIAGERIKCVRTRAPGIPPVLTHYASGSVLISAGARLRIDRYRTTPRIDCAHGWARPAYWQH